MERVKGEEKRSGILRSIMKYFNRLVYLPAHQFFIYTAILMFTNTILLITEPMELWAKAAFILIPLGMQTALLSLIRNPGLTFLLLLPKSVLDAFQLVLITLYGGSFIAVDMFLNVITTNPSEAGELLGNIAPTILFILIVYIPSIILAIRSLKKRVTYSPPFRERMIKASCVTLVCGFTALAGAQFSQKEFNAKYDLYPVNVLYNLDFAIKKWEKIKGAKEQMKNFTFNARLNDTSSSAPRKIFLLIVGETARAENWSLYGYGRETTPHLDTLENLIKFEAFSQSNTTHKSVPMLVTPANAGNYNLIYSSKSIVTLFKECGFRTAWITNHSYNQTFMENYFGEADLQISLRNGNRSSYDYPMVDSLNNILQQDTSSNLFIIMHLYGSHFNYQERYSGEFARFLPDYADNITPRFKEELVNSYDNTILSTDYLLDRVIGAVRETGCESFVIYTSDHGEDLMDDKRKRFLHASPLPTYYQLHVPFVIWYSNEYYDRNISKINVTLQNSRSSAISTNSTLFHTVGAMAGIRSEYLLPELALSSEEFKATPLSYLTDHDGYVEVANLPLKNIDQELFKSLLERWPESNLKE